MPDSCPRFQTRALQKIRDKSLDFFQYEYVRIAPIDFYFFEAKITYEATGKTLIEIAEEQSGRGERLDVPALAVGSYIYFVNTKALFQTWAGKMGTMLEELRKK